MQSVLEWKNKKPTIQVGKSSKIQPVSEWVSLKNTMPTAQVQDPTGAYTPAPRVYDTLSGTMETLSHLQEDPLSLKAKITEAPQSLWNAFKDAVTGGAEKMAAALMSFGISDRPVDKSTTPQKVGKAAEAVAGLAGSFFSPISAVFATADKIPVVGTISKLMSLPFSVAGEGASYVTGEAIDKIPDSVLSKEGKQQIKQGAQDIAALTSQFVVGGLAYKASAEGFTGTKVPFLPRISAKSSHPIAVEITAENPQIKDKVESLPAKQVDSLVEKYGEKDAKTIIKVAAEKAKRESSDLQMADITASAIGGEIDLRPTPNKTRTMTDIKSPSAPVEASKPAVAPVERPTQAVNPQVVQSSISEFQKPQIGVSNGLPTVSAEAPGAVSGIAKSIEAKAVEAGLTKGFSHLAEYNPITIREQAQLATTLIHQDIKFARKVVRGEEPLPRDLRGTSLITAMEEYIKKTGDKEAAYELANSPLVSGTSAAAQEMRLAAERVPDSATARLTEIRKAREAKIEKTGKKASEQRKKISDEIKRATEKVSLSKEELVWDKFLNEIKC